jgi:hypothetical protein
LYPIPNIPQHVIHYKNLYQLNWMKQNTNRVQPVTILLHEKHSFETSLCYISSRCSKNLTLQEEQMMKVNNIYWLRMMAIGFSLLVAGCSTFEVGIETMVPQTPSPEPQETEQIATETTESLPTATPTPTQTVESNFPELVSIGNLTPYGSSDTGVLVVQDGKVSAQPSPVYHEVFWDYNPNNGKLLFSPEFVHGSDDNNVSVTSLWVYDYETDSSEMWLEDNVVRAAWSPGDERVTAAVYNPETEEIDLVFVSGPNQVETIAECASNLFSWSPDGSQLAYVNAISWAGVKPACAGTYLVSFPSGNLAAEPQSRLISDFGSQALMSGDYTDQPIWASAQNALLYPDQPFWVIPLDGSPVFIPATPNGEDPLELPRPSSNLWAADLRQLVGYYEAGLSGRGGVWIYQLSEDLERIEAYFRIGTSQPGENSFITLVDWWIPGESILVLNGDNPDTSQYLNEYWPEAAIWSLTDMNWEGFPSQ